MPMPQRAAHLAAPSPKRPPDAAHVIRGTMRTRVRAALALVVFGVAVMLVLSVGAFSRLRIGSQRYEALNRNDELLIDVVPAAANLVDPFLVAHQLVDATQLNKDAKAEEYAGRLEANRAT